jgi:hypothetical protein
LDIAAFLGGQQYIIAPLHDVAAFGMPARFTRMQWIDAIDRRTRPSFEKRP